MLKTDCHIHSVLNGISWRDSLASHAPAPNETIIRQMLTVYRAAGYTHLRDGGDRFGACLLAKHLAPQYGITFLAPGTPLYKAGHYGSFIGLGYDTPERFRELVIQNREQGADFIKIMISGLMDFEHPGVLTEPPLPPTEIGQIVHICREEGMAVMAHANGTACVTAAAQAGVLSIEHGAYLHPEALAAMLENGVVWTPTLSAIANLRGKGRFSEAAVCEILDGAMENVARFHQMGGLVASGSDAGAWAVFHGGDTEDGLLADCAVTQAKRTAAASRIFSVAAANEGVCK